MLIDSLSLKNFKCFEELDVKFAPITLLTGANSSGKSSLINAILAVLQTEQFPFYLSPNGKYVNMGSFEEMVKKGSEYFQININLNILGYYSNQIEQTYTFKTTWKENSLNNLPSAYEIFCSESILQEDRFVFKLESVIENSFVFNYKVKIDKSDAISSKYFEFFLKHDFLKDYVYEDADGVGFRDVPVNSVFHLLEKIINNGDIFSIFSNYSLEHNQINDFFNYISSFRLAPERTYYQKSKASSKVAVSGDGYIDQIIEWEEVDNKNFTTLRGVLKDLELLQDIESNKLKGGRFELNVKNHLKSKSVSLTDVGFGVSQFLPIIVADIQLPSGSLLAVSQPEIHLHPKIQAQYGNYLANQIRSTQKQYIVETHSEYLLNRIRLLLVTGELKPEDVRVLYFENDGVKSTVHDVEFATDGQVKGAPQGFFDTYGIDVMDIAMNAVG